MSAKVIAYILTALLCTGIGIGAGWLAGGRTTGAGGEDTHAAATPRLSPSALRNLGVATTPLAVGSYELTQPVAAVVAVTPRYHGSVYAPAAGRVARVRARFGTVARAGEELVTLIREPIPRVNLTLTGDVLPSGSNLHEALIKLRSATTSVEILEKEKKRLSAFARPPGGEAVLSKKEILQVEYDLRRAQQELRAVQEELHRHGLNARQIEALDRRQLPGLDAAIWLGALRHNGFWNDHAEALYRLLPKGLRRLPWTAATLGELVAGDLALEGLLSWIKRDPPVGGRILAIGGLLQRGHSLADIRDLYDQGALEATIAVKAPAGAEDWDVGDIPVRPGGAVARGDLLVRLENPRRLYLQAAPTNSEIGLVVAAMKEGLSLAARPLVDGSGPRLEGLRIKRLFQAGETGRPALYLPLANRLLSRQKDDEGKVYRSWQLRPGQRYLVRIPKKTYAKAYVLPAAAVVDDGPDKVVFIRSGDDFQRVPVPVLHQDQEVAVLPLDADLFPGNRVVTAGAFALKLALEADGAGPGGCQGHSH